LNFTARRPVAPYPRSESRRMAHSWRCVHAACA